MINFSSIAHHLQVRIAEKMDYCDQMQFEISSKCGTDSVKITRSLPILDVHRIEFKNNDFTFVFNSEMTKNWSSISRVQNLPRFNVLKLSIQRDVALDLLTELGEKAQFVGEKVFLEINRRISLPFYTKLAEMFEIKMINCRFVEINLDLFSIPSFVQVDWFKACINEIPDEVLLQMKAKSIILTALRPRKSSIASLCFREWFRKEREIKWFSLEQNHRKDEDNIIPNELPVNILWCYEDQNQKKTFKVVFLKEPCVPYRLLGNDVIYSINRGDKKLLIIASGSRLIIATEYNELDEVIQIKVDNEDS